MPFQLPSVDDISQKRSSFLDGSAATPRGFTPTNIATADITIPPAYNHQQQENPLVIPDLLTASNSLQDVPEQQSSHPSSRDYGSVSAVTTGSAGAGDSSFDKAPPILGSPLDDISPNGSSTEKSPEKSGSLVKLARRRVNRVKDRNTRRSANISRPQGRPLSKETRVRLTLVPTLGILYSILVSDTMKKTLNVVKYGSEKDSLENTNEELSTRNVISGFSSLLNVQTVRFLDDPNVSPDRDSGIPEFNTIDEAVFGLFGVSEYSLIRVTRAAATEVGGSVLLKIETAMPGHLFLNDDEDEDFSVIEAKKDFYQESIGSIGDRPTTTFLKKRVARPRYKADMRIYLIPRAVSCAIYCETRMFKRDLLRGFLDMQNLDRSVIIAFEYSDLLRELEEEGSSDLLTKYSLPSLDEFKILQQKVQISAQQASNNQPHPPSLQQPYILHPGSTYPQQNLNISPQPYLVQGNFTPNAQLQQFDPNMQRFATYSQQVGQVNGGNSGYSQVQYKAPMQAPPYTQSIQSQQPQQMGTQLVNYANMYDPQQLPQGQGMNAAAGQASFSISGQAAYPSFYPLAQNSQSATPHSIQYLQQAVPQLYSPTFNTVQPQYIYRDSKNQAPSFNNSYQPM